ncbi:MAG: diguanylate cyclase [Treponema sp.]|nr:diguanylate cyclase [Treponema sp.]
MKYRRNINKKIILVLIIVLLVNLLGLGSYRLYVSKVQKNNEKKMDREIHNMKFTQNSISYDLKIINNLLELHNLTVKQLSELYMLKSTLFYTNYDMTSFFDNVGYALFYAEKAGNKDDLVYLYANMAKYFQELGDDSEASLMIRKAYEIRPFYECENEFTRLQSLQVLSRLSVEEGKFVEAEQAANQIIADSESEFINTFNPQFGVSYRRSAEVIKTMISLYKNDYLKAYEDSKRLYKVYYSSEEIVSQFNAFDFYLPVLQVMTESSIALGKYEEGLSYLKMYSDYCDQYFFTNLKLRYTKKVMMSVPETMKDARNQIFFELSEVAEKFEADLLRQFTQLTREKFLEIMETLTLKTDIKEVRVRKVKQIYGNFIVLLVAFIIIISLYSQLQLDPLTRLNNRGSLNTKIKKYSLLNKKYAAIMLDIDNFKHINDTYGHAYGDYVLQFVAKTLSKKEERGVTAYRYGGEEFVIIIENNDLEKAIRLSEDLRSSISRTRLEKDVRITASFGIGMVPENPIEQADKNMYKAKASGKNFTAYEKDGKEFLAERRLDIRNPIPKPKN